MRRYLIRGLCLAAFAPLAFAVEVDSVVTNNPNGEVDGQLIEWEGLADGDTGVEVESLAFADRTVQVIGTFGAGGELTMEGSNDGTNWVTLTDYAGDAIVFTAAGMSVVLENPFYIRPNVTAGDGTTDLDVIVLGKRIR
jgi:hypothetical protein